MARRVGLPWAVRGPVLGQFRQRPIGPYVPTLGDHRPMLLTEAEVEEIGAAWPRAYAGLVVVKWVQTLLADQSQGA